MGCSSSKDIENGSSVHRTRPAQQQIPYVLPQNMLPPSTLPPGWISQFDSNKQRLYYVYPQTGLVTWAHPGGPAADAQEMARFYQIQEMQRQQFGQQAQYQGCDVYRPYADSYNRMGGMGSGAAMAMGVVAGGAAGLLAGSLLADGMYDHGFYGGGYGGDVFPATEIGSGGGDAFPADFGGGGDFGGGDFGGGF
ncbi:hypothetical protein BGZ80_009634 [Entomortierella chlamydospora]|uniref:WW domain-containing protein n=1 Tax=Entomortierella chlamydospora TaxID=101097 RepID=A0A9P6MX18_9FUNG|nr:hypothetical protein BGZ80_009634 [Entomortierella chlamydospora]